MKGKEKTNEEGDWVMCARVGKGVAETLRHRWLVSRHGVRVV